MHQEPPQQEEPDEKYDYLDFRENE